MDLTTVGGNFLTDAYAIEAWDFRNQNSDGSFPGLFIPSRKLSLAGAGTVPLVPTSGHHGGGVYQPAACDQYLSMAADNSFNCLAAAYDWLAVSVWWRSGGDVIGPKLGVYGGAGARQWRGELGEGSQIAQVFNSSDTGPYYAGDNDALNGNWNHAVLQFHYDGLTTGVELRLRVNGVDYADLTGSLAITPTVASALGNFTLGFVTGAQSEDVEWGSLLMWKSGTAPLDSDAMDDLYNSGLGIQFVPGGQRAYYYYH